MSALELWTAAAAPAPGLPPEPRRFFPISCRSRLVHTTPPVAQARHEVFLCDACGARDHDKELLLYDRGRHTFCLCPIIVAVLLGPWLCPVCVLNKSIINEYLRATIPQTAPK